LFPDVPYEVTYDQLDPYFKELIELKPQSAIQRVPGPPDLRKIFERPNVKRRRKSPENNSVRKSRQDALRIVASHLATSGGRLAPKDVIKSIRSTVGNTRTETLYQRRQKIINELVSLGGPSRSRLMDNNLSTLQTRLSRRKRAIIQNKLREDMINKLVSPGGLSRSQLMSYNLTNLDRMLRKKE